MQHSDLSHRYTLLVCIQLVSLHLIDFNEFRGDSEKDLYCTKELWLLHIVSALSPFMGFVVCSKHRVLASHVRQTCLTYIGADRPASPLAIPVTLYYSAIIEFLKAALSQHVGEELVTMLLIPYQPRADTTACQSSDPSLADLLTHWLSLLMLCDSSTHTALAYKSLGTVTHVPHNPI